MVPVLGTCPSICAEACRAADATRSGESPLMVALVVVLLIFLAADAAVAAIAIYGAGRRNACPVTRVQTSLYGLEQR